MKENVELFSMGCFSWYTAGQVSDSLEGKPRYLSCDQILVLLSKIICEINTFSLLYEIYQLLFYVIQTLYYI